MMEDKPDSVKDYCYRSLLVLGIVATCVGLAVTCNKRCNSDYMQPPKLEQPVKQSSAFDRAVVENYQAIQKK